MIDKKTTLTLSDHVLITIARLPFNDEADTFEDCIINLINKYEALKK